MIIEKIHQEDLDFCFNLAYPVAIVETMFSNLDNLTEFLPDKFSELRVYQYPMISGEPIIDVEMPNLTPKQKFELKKNAGEIYNFGARRFGKSLCSMKLDILISMLTESNTWVGFSSADSIHLQDVLDVVIRTMSFHPILKMWKQRFRASPKYSLETKAGYLLDGVNQNIASSDAGKQFFGKHFFKLYIDENSLENDESYDKRKDAVSELGCINRCSGMTDFLKFSPAGKAFENPENQNKIINLPQYVNPNWDDEEDKKRQIEFGGKDSLNYLVFVKGQHVSDGLSEFDMTRIEKYIDRKTEVKTFEIKKDSFSYFKNLLIVERPKNAERIFISADIGDGTGGSSLLIHSEIGTKYNYLYRIDLYSLTDEEQFFIFDYLIQKLSANVVAIDNGDGCGRAIYRRLEKKYPKENLVYYSGGEKIGVDWKKDDKGKIVLENSRPVLVEEFMSEWSIRFLKSLLYEGRINLPVDYKLFKQLSAVVSRMVGTRTVYACISENGDHVFDAHKVFAIAVFLKKDFNSTPKLSVESGLGVSSWTKRIKMNIDKNKWRAIFEKQEELQITREEYINGFQYFLQMELVKYQLENRPEILKYLEKEIQRLNETFKEN
jgi:hypothetical protein